MIALSRVLVTGQQIESLTQFLPQDWEGPGRVGNLQFLVRDKSPEGEVSRTKEVDGAEWGRK